VNDNVISTLNDLIATSKDGEKGFAMASRDTQEPDLTGLFKDGEESCRAAAAELQDQVRLLGGVAEDDGTVKAAVHRGWISAKAVMISRDSKALLEECERGEEYARARYGEAMKVGLPEPVRSVVDKQYQHVIATHDRVRILRNRYHSTEIPRTARSNG
jgi:uncharacterized protein (TIGR02284 family)